MKLLKKILNFFLSTTLGAWCFAIVVACVLFGIAKFYLACYSTPGGNLVKDLQPLAVLIIGLASVLIAASNWWGKLGHSITCRVYVGSNAFEKHRSHMHYIKNIVLCNKKNKVEVIEKILLHSKKLKYTTLVDFGKDFLVLENYKTKVIPLKSVTAWVGGIDEKNITIAKSFNFFSDDQSITTTIKKGSSPTLYVTYPNYFSLRKKMPKILAKSPFGLIPIEFEEEKNNFETIFPIRNIDQFSDEQQGEEIIYDASLIQITELTLGKSNEKKELEGKKVRVFLHNHQERYFFDNFIDKDKPSYFTRFSNFQSSETRDFEKEWKNYYNKEKQKQKEFSISQFKKLGKNLDSHAIEISRNSEIALEKKFYKKALDILNEEKLGKNLLKISSTITSRMIFLHEVNCFSKYPILKKRHTLFATAFYPTKKIHPCFEEIEESIFSKIRHWLFGESPPTP